MATFNDLNGICFLSQNINSLNLSTRFQLSNNLNRFDQKLESILDKKAEITLLQDVRLGTEGEKILKKRLEFHNYYLDPLVDPQFIIKIKTANLRTVLSCRYHLYKKSINNFPNDKLLTSVIEKNVMKLMK